MYMHKVTTYWHWYLLDMYVEKPIIWHLEASWPDQWQIVAPWWDPVVMSLQSSTGHELKLTESIDNDHHQEHEQEP